MNILITGARAPICADIVYALTSAGHRVWVSDSLRFPVGRFCPKVEGYLRLPAPRKNFAGFEAGLVAGCKRLGIERIIPTSEEVFWLSAVKGLPATCQGFFPSQEVLGQLHDKQRFAALAQSLGYGAPENHLLSSVVDVAQFVQNKDSAGYVFKPVYSRFASDVLISPAADTALRIRPTAHAPWLAQTRALGPELCVYNIAVEGELIMHAAYRPRWRAGKGASVYFEPEVSAQLQEMSAQIVAATKFTGQISFDVIETADGLVALECNPRGTSGVHLASQSLGKFSMALMGKKGGRTGNTTPAMLAVPLLMYNPRMLWSPEGRKAWRIAQDAMAAVQIPFRAQVLATIELLARAVLAGQSAIAESTADIEWNGEPIGAPA
jgi:hypothetical protein